MSKLLMLLFLGAGFTFAQEGEQIIVGTKAEIATAAPTKTVVLKNKGAPQAKQRDLGVDVGTAPDVCPKIDAKKMQTCEDNDMLAAAADECLYRMEEVQIIAADALESKLQNDESKKQSEKFAESAADYRSTEEIVLRLNELLKNGISAVKKYESMMFPSEDAEAGIISPCFTQNKKVIKEIYTELQDKLKKSRDAASIAQLFKKDTDRKEKKILAKDNSPEESIIVFEDEYGNTYEDPEALKAMDRVPNDVHFGFFDKHLEDGEGQEGVGEH